MRSWTNLSWAIWALWFGISANTPCAFGHHRIVLQGNDRLVQLAPDGRIEWEMKWGPIHDIHILPSGHFLVQQGPAKVAEIDPKTKQVVKSYDAARSPGNAGKKIEVHAFQPLPSGGLMIAESGSGRLIEIDQDGAIQKEVRLKVDHPHPHTDTRLARKLANGNYLVCHEGDGVVREYDGTSGKVIWEYPVPLFGETPRPGHGPEAYGNKCFAAVRLANGNTLMTTGNGHSVLEVTPNQEIVWQIRQHDLVRPEGGEPSKAKITLAWVTTIALLPSGNYLIGNCHAGPGQPLLIEIEPKTKRVVWTLDRFDDFGNNVSNSLVLMPAKGR